MTSTSNVLPFKPNRVRKKRRELVGEIKLLSAQVAAKNYRSRDWFERRLTDGYRDGSIIMGSGANAVYCTPDPEDAQVYLGDSGWHEIFGADGSLEQLRLNELAQCRARLQQWLHEHP